MGKGAAVTTGGNVPTFRSGNIVCPPTHKATERKGITVKIGNGDAPDWGLARPQSMTTGTSILGTTRKVPRQNLATTIAKMARGEVAVPVRVTLTQTPGDIVQGIYRETNGVRKINGRKIEQSRVVRTLDMGDDALPTNTVPVADVAPVVKVTLGKDVDAGKADRTADRQATDTLVLAYLRSVGYKGSLTADIRSLALDALEFQRQIVA